MEYRQIRYDDLQVAVRIGAFEPRNGVKEYHWMFVVENPLLTAQQQVTGVHEAYNRVLKVTEGVTVLMRRYFLSDMTNQQPLVEQSVENDLFCATSLIQQAPLNGTKVALWAYAATSLSLDYGKAEHNGYTHYWMAGSAIAEGESEHQMRELFDAYRMELKGVGMRIEEHCVRTWIFVRDVDFNYSGVVKGRRRYFDRIGLTAKTHYIASTGIEGRPAHPAALVQMDAYAVGGLKEGQKSYLYAKTHLNPTYEYGVTFERGTAVEYGDRKQLYISGTASINAKGEVMYVGDVVQQTHRMWENVEALLAEGGATFKEVAMAIVYLRDSADYAQVHSLFAERFPSLPCQFVLAPVCRPTWLVEMECMAIVSNTNTLYTDF